MTAPRLPRLDDIRARLNAATPGPWERVDDGEIVHKGVAVASVMQDYDFPCLDPDDGSQTRAECEANVLLIQHAPEDIAFLLALVEKREQLLREALGWLASDFESAADPVHAAELYRQRDSFMGQARAALVEGREP